MKQSNLKVAVTSASFAKLNVLRDYLESMFENVVYKTTPGYFNEDEFIEFAKDCDAAIVGLDPVTEKVLKNSPNLKMVSKYGVGLNNIDQDACNKYNVKIGWTGGVNRRSVAEQTLAKMIFLSRNLYTTSQKLKKGIWHKDGGLELSELTIGIIGVGFIGKDLIQLLTPFGAKVLVNDIIDQSNYYNTVQVESVSKDEIYEKSDIITLHVPLDESTHYLINKDVLDRMKPSAFIINTCRGAVVNLLDLKDALKNNIIAGAAIDVYEEEPPQDLEFLALENLICTPHISGNSKKSIELMGRSAIDHLKSYFFDDNKE